MRKMLSLLLILSIVITLVVPTTIFAEGESSIAPKFETTVQKNENDLKKVITAAKAKFQIPEDYTEFNYNVYTEFGKEIWSLNWSKKDNTGSIDVGLDNNGTIYRYYTYKVSNDQGYETRFAKVDKNDARDLAENFIRKINPKVFSKIKLDNSYDTYMESEISGRTHNFNYIRIENNLPVYNSNYYNNNSINVSVDKYTGEVTSYSYNWTENLVFPKPENIISKDDAQKLYKEKLGLQLMYKYTMKDEKLQTYLVYGPKYPSYHLDAFTGEIIKFDSRFYGGYAEDTLKYSSSSVNSGTMFTPEELAAIDEISNIITSEEAEKIARNSKFIGITYEYELTSKNLYKDWMIKDDMSWSLDFSAQLKKDAKTEIRQYISVGIDAKTGEIKSFYRNIDHDNNAKGKYNEEKPREIVENFLKEFAPERFKNVGFDENYLQGIIRPLDSSLPLDYSFRYNRKVNGIVFDANGINVGIDTVSGEITSYNCTWYNTTFDNPKNVISIDKVYEKVFDEIGLELGYQLINVNDYYEKYAYDSNIKPDVKLVYSMSNSKPLIIDAFKNILLGSDGKPFKEANAYEYSDIENSYAKGQISKLAELGIGLSGEEFKPGQNILQKEFLYLLSHVFYSYNVFDIDTKDGLDGLYNMLASNGIVKEGEKAPDSSITREESLKFFIRFMNYQKVADLEGIFKCSFADSSDITPELYGYVTIAQGFGIISGHAGNFNPKSNLNRADAIVMIYNYLNR